MFTFLSVFNSIASLLIPVATTDTLIIPSKLSSIDEPKIIFAFSSTSFLILLAASSTSNNAISGPPFIFNKIDFAPLILLSSRSGLLRAASAAFLARSSPELSPVPIIALPILPITVLISAKSRFIIPGFVIKSVIPQIP